MQECIFANMYSVVDDKIRITYQKDFSPGLAVRGDEDMIDNNEIVYLEVDTTGLFSSNPSSIQYNNIEKERELIKIVDLLGRETHIDKNIPLLYIYNDGTVEKRYRLKK